MAFQAFLNDPKSYLSTHAMSVSNGGATLQAMTHDAPQPIPGSIIQRMHWHQRAAGPFLTMVAGAFPVGPAFGAMAPAPKGRGERVMDTLRHLPFVDRKVKQYTLATVNADLGFRYLPFNADHCTYMRITGTRAPNGTVVITGPLSGCTIAVVRSGGGNLWILHANNNQLAGVAARDSQWAAITHVVTTRINVPIGGARECRYGRDYNGLGFVFGHARPNGVWKFYAHASAPGGGTETRKWAEL